MEDARAAHQSLQEYLRTQLVEQASRPTVDDARGGIDSGQISPLQVTVPGMMVGALARVYLNIGLFSEEWLLHFRPLLGGAQTGNVARLIADCPFGCVIVKDGEIVGRAGDLAQIVQRDMARAGLGARDQRL